MGERRQSGLFPLPEEPLPPIGTLGFRIQRYGMLQWRDLFTARQQISLVELGELSSRVRGGRIPRLLAVSIDKTADLGNALTLWKPDAECPVHLFARQAIGMAWDFCESVPPSESSGSFLSAVQRSADALGSVDGSLASIGQVQLADAIRHPLSDVAATVWFTDPPYYDAVPYSDLSDFFLVWLKRTLQDEPLLRDPFDFHNGLSPKAQEVVQDETKTSNGRVKDRGFFEATMGPSLCGGPADIERDRHRRPWSLPTRRPKVGKPYCLA